MPERLALAEVRGLGWVRWLYWYDQRNRLPSLEERTALTEQELEHERQRTEQAQQQLEHERQRRNRSDAREKN